MKSLDQRPVKDRNCPDLPPPSYWERACLVRGGRYRVTKEFYDADGDEHAVGEEWLFIGSMFSKFDNEYTLFVRLLSGEEWCLPLRSREEQQREIIDRFAEHIARL